MTPVALAPSPTTSRPAAPASSGASGGRSPSSFADMLQDAAQPSSDQAPPRHDRGSSATAGTKQAGSRAKTSVKNTAAESHSADVEEKDNANISGETILSGLPIGS